MRKSSLTVLIVAGIACLLAVPASAAVFSADFEAGYTSGPMPSGLLPNGLYPDTGTGILGKPAGQSPNWNANGWSSNPDEGIDTWPPNDAFVVVDPANPANHAAAFVGDSSGGPVRPSSVASKMTLNTTNDITISQRAYYPSAMNAGEHRALVTSFLQAVGLYFGTSGYFGSGNLCWTLDTSSGWTIKEVTPDAWHEAVVVVHVATSTADFSVDGQSVVMGKAVNLSNFTGPAKYNAYSDNTNVDFGSGGNDYGAILLDEVSITQVPEPASLSLLVLAGAAALRRHRK